MQNQILIGKNVNYASSKASTTADTATSPELLRDGAIGFYTETGTLIPAAGTGMAAATKFYIAQGTSTGCIVTPILDKRSTIKRKDNRDYTAPVRQISYVGFNGTTGSLATPTILENDEAQIKLIETTVGRQTFPKQTYSAILNASDDDYTVAHKLVLVMNSEGFSGSDLELVQADVVTNGTAAEFDANPTVTLNSRTVTFAGNDTTYGGGATELVTGDLVLLRGNTYKVVSNSPTGTVVLDRPYTGVTETINVGATVNAAARLSSVTEAGVKLTCLFDGRHFRLAVGGVIQDANISYTTPFNPGSGTFAQISQLEKDFTGASRGSWNKVGPYAIFGAPTLYADSAALYDMWNIRLTNTLPDKTGMAANVGTPIYVIVAINNAATGANTALDTITALI